MIAKIAMRPMALVILLLITHIAQAGPLPSKRPDPLASPKSQVAARHLVAGNKWYAIRDFDRAIEEYKAGALVQPTPVFDYNLGQCFRNLGKYKEALWYYQRFLDNGSPEGELLDIVEDFMAQMKSELDRKAMSQPPNNTGPVASSGTDTEQQATPAPTSPPEQKVAELRAAPPPSRATQRWYDDGVAWSFAGAGCAGVGVGIGFLMNASSLRSKANETRIQAEYRKLSDSAHTRGIIGGVATAGGAALVIAGVVKLVLVPSDRTPRSAWNITFTGEQIALSGRF